MRRRGWPFPPGRKTPPNVRTPSFDLDSVYGGGPQASRQLYDPRDLAKFKVEYGGLFEDLPRTPDGTAIIADPRNDENLMIAGLQVAMLQFHNRVVDRLRDDGDGDRRASRGRSARGRSPRTSIRIPAAACSSRRAGWSPGTTSGSSSTSSCRRSSARRWSATSWSAARGSTPRASARRASRWSSRARASASATAWSGRRTAPTWPATTASRSSGSSSTRPVKISRIRSTCAAVPGRRGGSSAGRRSSTSAGTRRSTCARTRRSTRRSRRRCSTCRSAPSPAAICPPRCRSATCSGT